MVDSYWNYQIAKYNAVKVKFGLTKGKLPKPEDIPNKAIWFETTNFGWILSAVPRRTLVKY